MRQQEIIDRLVRIRFRTRDKLDKEALDHAIAEVSDLLAPDEPYRAISDQDFADMDERDDLSTARVCLRGLAAAIMIMVVFYLAWNERIPLLLWLIVIGTPLWWGLKELGYITWCPIQSFAEQSTRTFYTFWAWVRR